MPTKYLLVCFQQDRLSAKPIFSTLSFSNVPIIETKFLLPLKTNLGEIYSRLSSLVLVMGNICLHLVGAMNMLPTPTLFPLVTDFWTAL